jgi:hypothetical protein
MRYGFTDTWQGHDQPNATLEVVSECIRRLVSVLQPPICRLSNLHCGAR